MDPLAEKVFDFALRAYHDGDIETAVEYFSKSLCLEDGNWQCRFYLAMSYYRAERVADAISEFVSIGKTCPEQGLRLKARAFVNTLSASSAAGLEMSA